jgi:hypothetical protein
VKRRAVPLHALAWLFRVRRKLLFLLPAASCVMAGWSHATVLAQWHLADE